VRSLTSHSVRPNLSPQPQPHGRCGWWWGTVASRTLTLPSSLSQWATPWRTSLHMARGTPPPSPPSNTRTQTPSMRWHPCPHWCVCCPTPRRAAWSPCDWSSQPRPPPPPPPPPPSCPPPNWNRHPTALCPLRMGSRCTYICCGWRWWARRWTIQRGRGRRTRKNTRSDWRWHEPWTHIPRCVPPPPNVYPSVYPDKTSVDAVSQRACERSISPAVLHPTSGPTGPAPYLSGLAGLSTRPSRVTPPVG
jgi:hypothetical protein